MSRFLLHTTIETRKVVFVELKRTRQDAEAYPDRVDDQFVIRLPEGAISRNELLMIRKSSIVQAIGEEVKDIPLSSLQLYLRTTVEGDLELLLTDNLASEAITRLDLANGLSIRLRDEHDFIQLLVYNEDNLNAATDIRLRLVLDLKFLVSEPGRYVGYCRFQLAPRNSTRFLALDFGSEASQMREGSYGGGEELTIHSDVVNLFSLIRSGENQFQQIQDAQFEQFESDRLYKSVFYADRELSGKKASYTIQGRDFYWLNGGLSMTVPSNELNARDGAFLKEKAQIPNLKLVRTNTNLSSGIRFQMNSGLERSEKSFSELRGTLYMALLQRMLHAYFKNKITAPLFLRLTLLVPNIYSPEEIQETRKIVGDILDGYSSESGLLAGYELDCLSESDASFLGCTEKVEVLPNNYYIIVDCGKGTTDYSILEIEQGNNTIFRPLYRNGFAGAGNYITYAFIKAAFSFLLHDFFTDDALKQKVRIFLDSMFEGNNLFFHKQVFAHAERWKKNQASRPPASRESIERSWREAVSGQIGFAGFFESWPNRLDESTFLELLANVNDVWDWNDHIASAMEVIVSEITTQLEPVIQHQNSHAQCGGIILTGRGSLYEPLANALTHALQGIRGMEKVQRVNIDGFNLKEVCLNGVFSQSLRFYADLSSTPVEVDTQQFRQVRKKSSNWLSRLFGGGSSVGAAYDPETNSIEVINGHNLTNTRFLIGGKVFKVPPGHGSASTDRFTLVPTRNATYLLEKKQDGRVSEIRSLVQDNDRAVNEDRIFDSLYPGWYRSSISNTL
jgi:hypothetical protein